MRSLLPLLLLAACDVLEEPDPAAYDASCAVDDDCAATIDQGFCGACDRADALATSSVASFEDDQDAYGARHHCRVTIAPNCTEVDLAAFEPWCDAGTCGLRVAP